MKYLWLMVLTGLMACTHQQMQASHKSPERATSDDCKNVYQYILTMVVNDQVDTERTMSPREHEGAEWALDQQWMMEGIKEKFLSACQAGMTTAQVECALHVSHVDDLHTCMALLH